MVLRIHPAARLTTKRFLLQILNAIEGHRASAAALIRAAEVMGISDNSVRVTLARLKAAGLLVNDQPGAIYSLSPGALRVQRHVAGWQKLENRVGPWDGSWVAISTGGLPRGDRKALAARRRSMNLFGFEELAKDLRVRPNNLAMPLDELRRNLVELGLDEEAILFEIRRLGDRDDAQARALWDGESLDRWHRQMREDLEQSFEEVSDLPLDEAAKQTFLLGNQAIHQLVLDPLLPEPLVDVEARHELIDTMKRYDDIGRRLWRQVIDGTTAETQEALEPAVASA